MEPQPIRIFNTLTRKKELFSPIHPPFVGIYVCGPTVYRFMHLGNLRTFTTFDVIYRYLKFAGYKVRYVRNITDVGHITTEFDEGVDRIGEQARMEQLEPMEIVQKYTNNFHEVLSTFNCQSPSIEPAATRHIIEQIEMVKDILKNGYAYETNGSVYFDVRKYNEKYKYGELSGRNIEELFENTRELDGQDEKRYFADFALWKKASPDHIMQWPSPWGMGFPGWHLECSVMSTKYLGAEFDIHGGGMDLKFPHHECEIAQNTATCGHGPVRYWIHSNMLTVNGQKMSKSLGNSFLPADLISGNHPLLEQAYSPMTVRFFMLQSHYSSTLDFSNEALKASLKGYKKIANGLKLARQLKFVSEENPTINEKQVQEIKQTCQACYDAMNDDFNTAITIGHLFNLLKKINMIQTGSLNTAELGVVPFEMLIHTFISFTEEVLGLKEEKVANSEYLLQLVIDNYREAKDKKEYEKVDKIRGQLKQLGIVLKDMKNQIDWAYEE